MSQQRAQIIHRLRGNAFKIFGFGNPDYFENSFDRSELEEFKSLLRSPKKPNQPFALYPRILYPDGDADRATKVFMNPCLPKVRRRSLLSNPSNLSCRF